ncbi:PEP-CTERM sorting domain-containing protein [bacterium]|nr:MAG: PEP-CTERM sorting domain-containing protein [bacterium]
MKILGVLTLSALAGVASAAGNLIQNSDFGVGSPTLANWDLIEYIGADPAPGHIGVTSQYFVSSRHSASFQGNFDFTNAAFYIRQEFGPVTNVEEISLYGLSRDQDIRVHLLYTDGTADFLSKYFTIPDLNVDPTNADWVKWDLTSELDLGKTLKGIEVGIDTGGANRGYDAWVDDITVRATAVPEPGSMVALGLGVAALLRRRRV